MKKPMKTKSGIKITREIKPISNNKVIMPIRKTRSILDNAMGMPTTSNSFTRV